MGNAVNIFFQNFHWVTPAYRHMAGIQQQCHQLGVSHFHQPVNFLHGFNTRSGMWMEAKSHIVILGHFAQSIQAVCQILKLRIAQDRPVGEQRNLRMDMNRNSNLAYRDNPCAQRIREIQVILKACKRLCISECSEVAGIPHIANHQVTQIQGFLQCRNILGILMANLSALESRQSHFANTLLIGEFTA